MLVQTSTAVEPFLGSKIKASYEASRVVIFPLPDEATKIYRKGCENDRLDGVLYASEAALSQPFTGIPNWIKRAIANIYNQPVFITIDLKGIDPALIFGVGTPESSGLNWYSVTTFWGRVLATDQVIGCKIRNWHLWSILSSLNLRRQNWSTS